MRTQLRLFILFMLFSFPLLISAQQLVNDSATRVSLPAVRGTCGWCNNPNTSTMRSGPNNPSPQNGNGTLGNIYNQTKCGLNFSQASQRIGQRFSPAGVLQPAPFVISGIPSCAVIEKAYLWAEGSGNGAAQTATVNGPVGSANYPMSIIGQGPDKCWSYAGSYTYRADVTPSVNGNGTYNISGLLTNPPTSGNDMDGATLLVIWSDPTQTYRGTVIIDDGAMIVNTFGGSISYNMNYPAVCGTTTGAQVFGCMGDLQMTGTTLSFNGTVPAYAWNWWNYIQAATTISTGQTTSNFTATSTSGDCFNLCVAGIYYQTTCVACASSAPITLTTSATPATCAACNGTATVNVTPVGVYTYSWSPSAQTGSTATGLCAGTYVVTVTASCGTATATVVVPSTGGTINVNNTAQTNASCNGGCNGSVTVTASGGTAPYTFSWAPAVTNTTTSPSNTATGLCAGTYVVTSTDAGGCTGTQTVIITQPTPLAGTFAQTNVSCNAGTNGTASITMSGGTSPYTFVWAPAVTNSTVGSTNTATGLAAGTYVVTATDANGCTFTHTFTITQPTALSGTFSQTNVLCNAGSNGTAVITMSGGTGPYTFVWAPAAANSTVGNTNTATGLSVNTYVVTATDANGCTFTHTYIITQPPALSSTFSQVDVLCNAGATGSATITMSGGTGPYTFTWAPAAANSTVGSTNTATGLAANTYVVTATDLNGCTYQHTFTITQPTALSATFAQTDVSCNGGSNGTASITMSGGTGPYTFTWAPAAANSTVGSTNTATGLAVGSYVVTATDANGCTFPHTFTITQPTPLTATTSAIPSTCGNANGSATVTPSGGTGVPTVLWTPSAQTTLTAVNLLAGVYSVTVTDANNCTYTTTVTVPNTGSPTLTVTTFTNVTCNGACNGTVTVTAASGTGPYTFAWAPACANTTTGNSNTATALCPGVYNCTVTDANGCSATASVTITEPPALAITPSQVNLLCNGVCNGSATVAVTGGTPGYTYLWSPSGGTGPTASGLCAGNYSCLVTDLNSCTLTQTFTITEPTLLTLASAGFNVTCFGVCDGQVVVIPSGGTPNYSFSWSTGCTAASCNNICAGTYVVTVTDFNGCVATSTATVTQPTAVVVTATSVDAHCNLADGSASSVFSGGTGALTPVWYSPATPGANLTNVVAGNYYVVVTDANGCDDTANVTINNIPGVTATPGVITPVSCFGGNNGAAAVNVTGGTGTITYVWSCSPSTTNTANNLVAGPCSVVVTDSAGCTSTVNVTINEPTQLTVTATASPTAICAGQSSTITGTGAGGTPPYAYGWNPGALIGAVQTVSPASTQTYTVLVTDANSCSDSATVTVTVNPNPVAVLAGDSLSGCAPHCVNFSDLSSVASGTITGWSWDFGDGNTSTQQNPNHCYLLAGNYTVILTITTASGCTGTITMPNYVAVYGNPVAEFSAAPQPTTELNPVITFTDLSTNANTWSWSFGDVNNGGSTLQNPSYDYGGPGCFDVLLTVTTINGCIDTTVHQVCIDPDVTLFVPNAFTPNGDGVNDVFYPQGVGIDPDHFEMWIFDRWGNMIYYTDDLAKPWDGKVQGHENPCQQDVYVWKIKANDLMGGKHNLIGHVSLIR